MKFDSGYFDCPTKTHVTYTPWRCNIERNYEAIDLGSEAKGTNALGLEG